MLLRVISSSSEGNCYLLTSSEGSTLILECGVPLKDILLGLNFSLAGVCGCIVTHRHNDHARSVEELARRGITVATSADVLEAKRVAGKPFTMEVSAGVSISLGDYKITPLRAYHDVPCLAYVVEHPEMGKMMLATDTYKLPYKVRGLRHLLIECNYTDAALCMSETEGICPSSLRDRLMLSHMELKTTAGVVANNTQESLQTVVLIHLSHDNSDSEEMVETVSSVSGLPTYTAYPGMVVNLDKNPY